MNDWLLLLAGGATGAVAAWALATLRARASAEIAKRDLERRTAAAEARAEEIRGQLHEAHGEIDALHQRAGAAERALAAAEAQTREVERHLAEDRRLLDEARTRLSDAFRSLAADALAHNNQGFLLLAEQKFKALREEAAGELDARRRAVEGLIEPLATALHAYQQETQALERTRQREAGILGEQLRAHSQASATLQAETAKLVNALRSPSTRGRWGEITLRRTAELAGMAPYCDFVEQEIVDADNGGRLRPDMVVRLPAGREVVVDSKVPLAGYLEALESTTDERRLAALGRHANQVRQHIGRLASKEYWEQFASAPEFVVLFIPNDSFLAAAAEQDPAIIEAALARRVVVATPTTFIALLRAVAFGWRQELVAANAQRISELGQELSERMGTLVEHFLKVGGSLGKAVESYNAAVASFESRVLPTARRFRALGAGARKEIEELEPLDQAVRPVSLFDFEPEP